VASPSSLPSSSHQARDQSFHDGAEISGQSEEEVPNRHATKPLVVGGRARDTARYGEV
jgi:hypothetical protein